VHSSEAFFNNILLQKKHFVMIFFFFENNTKNSYVDECQMKGLLHNVESLQTYLIQYANWNLFENEKHIQLFQMFL